MNFFHAPLGPSRLFHLIAALGLVAMPLAACQDGGASIVRFDAQAIHQRAALDSTVFDELVVEVSGSDGEGQSFSFDASQSAIEFQVSGSGLRLFKVSAIRASDSVLIYGGETSATVEPGTTLELAVDIYPYALLTGTLSITTGEAWSGATLELTTDNPYPGQDPALSIDLNAGSFSVPVIATSYSLPGAVDGMTLLGESAIAELAVGEVREISPRYFVDLEKCAPTQPLSVINQAPACHFFNIQARNFYGGALMLRLNDHAPEALTNVDLTTLIGSTTLAYGVAEGDSYNVVIDQQPSGPIQTCTLTGGSGVMGTSDVGLTVNCDEPSFRVSVNVLGLTEGSLSIIDEVEGVTPVATLDSSGGATQQWAYDKDYIEGEYPALYFEHSTGNLNCVEGLKTEVIRGNGLVSDFTYQVVCRPKALLPYYDSGRGNGDFSFWIKDDGADVLSASNSDCSPGDGDPCLHLGEFRKFPFLDVDSCEGLQISDSFGVFDWTCIDEDDTTPGVTLVSQGFSKTGGVREMFQPDCNPETYFAINVDYGESYAYIDIADPIWDNNVITVTSNDFAGHAAGDLHCVPSGFTMNLTVMDGALFDHFTLFTPKNVPLLQSTGVNETAITLSNNTFVWFETDVDSAAGGTIRYSNVAYATVRNSDFSDPSGVFGGLYDEPIVIDASSRANVQGITSTNGHRWAILTLTNTTNSVVRDIYLTGAGQYGEETVPAITVGTGSENNLFESIEVNRYGMDAPALLVSGKNNTFRDIHTLFSVNSGIWVEDEGNRFENISIMGAGADGMLVTSAGPVTIQGLRTSNNATSGLSIDSNANSVITDVLATHNGNQGVAVLFSNNIVLGRVSAFGNGDVSDTTEAGIYFDASSNITAFNIVSSGNNIGVRLDSTDVRSQVNFFDLVATDNFSVGVDETGGEGVTYSGTLAIGGNGTDCEASSYGEGLPLLGCDLLEEGFTLLAGVSDAVVRPGRSWRGGFVGVTETDKVNTDLLGSLGYIYGDAITTDHWENPYRTWAQPFVTTPFYDGSTPSNCSQYSNCGAFDWRTTRHQTLSRVLTTGAVSHSVVEHQWSDGSSTFFYPLAKELGANGDGLCGVGDTCVEAASAGVVQSLGPNGDPVATGAAGEEISLAPSPCQNGDGICGAGCHQRIDEDCPAVCGNGVQEVGEACDGSDLPDLGVYLFEDHCNNSCERELSDVCFGGSISLALDVPGTYHVGLSADCVVSYLELGGAGGGGGSGGRVAAGLLTSQGSGGGGGAGSGISVDGVLTYWTGGGGGGGAGSRGLIGGNGGDGGVIASTNVPFASGSTFTVNIGAGGKGACFEQAGDGGGPGGGRGGTCGAQGDHTSDFGGGHGDRAACTGVDEVAVRHGGAGGGRSEAGAVQSGFAGGLGGAHGTTGGGGFGATGSGGSTDTSAYMDGQGGYGGQGEVECGASGTSGFLYMDVSLSLP